MHELSVCQALLEQVTLIAREQRALKINEISVLLGPLAGVEAALLSQAFTIARCNTVACEARLVIQEEPVIVRCRQCGETSEVGVNQLQCASCQARYPELISGDSLVLSRISLERQSAATHEPIAGPGAHKDSGQEVKHV